MTTVLQHANQHARGAEDPIALDALDFPTDTAPFPATLDATTARHGLLPRLSGNTTDYLAGTGVWTVIPPAPALDGSAPPSDNTNNNASTSAHGLLPKLSGSQDTFLRGDGLWTVPPRGPTGPAGTPGTVWRAGRTNPSGNVGRDGDLFVNTTTADVLQRANGAYTKLFNLAAKPAATSRSSTLLHRS